MVKRALLLGLCCVILGTLSLTGSQASVTGVGSASILEVKDLLIVYPHSVDGSAQGDSIGKQIAEAKAAFLRRSKNTIVEVKSDLEWTPEDKTRNQLWLGWDTQMFERTNLKTPFQRASDGRFVFLGRSGDRGQDLLFTFPNPWRKGAILSFWSRLDPALDRLSVHPILGSDWAIYDAYLPVQQGMFQHVDVWPPKREEEAQADHRQVLSSALEGWKTKNQNGIKLTYDPETIDEAEATNIFKIRSQAWQRALKATGSEQKVIPRIYIYSSVNEKVKFTGVPDPSHTIPWEQEIHSLTAYASRDQYHEELHVLTEADWGQAKLATLYEGRAIEIEDEYRNISLSTYATAWNERDKLPKLEQLFRAGATQFETPQEAESLFPAAALFLRYLEQTYGVDAAKRAYRSDPGSERAFSQSLKMDSRALEQSFHQWLKNLNQGDDLKTRRLRDLARAEQLYKAGDWSGLADHLEAMLKESPQEFTLAHNLANTYIRLERYQDAEQLLEKVVTLAQQAENIRYQLVGHYDLGRVRDYQGKRDEALKSYREVLKLPDARGMHSLAQTAIYTPLKPGEGR